ncbi:hypothetical protein [Albibacterium bauzanense]|uniref:DUF4136 domain-containing protein n=1 Tax=Albibacterium bauzanense TaxID=653929 RepID=A0A4R1M483_9SPHI|nr:hypothetical protein [Albibacterium bauzanense]TCK85694.1 hypothetical protein C8N28_1006 [Albibacterium bauzanense]
MKKFILPIIALFIFSGCSSTRLVSSWKAPDETVKQYNKVLVLGLMDPKNLELRENLEKGLVQGFLTNGMASGSAYIEYGPKAFEKLTEKEAVAKITDNGYDAVLVVALLDRSKDKDYVPGSVSYRPYTYYNYFWGFYQTVYARIYNPGYYTESTNYTLEANFYDLSTKALKYSAQTKSFNPSSARSLGTELSQVIMTDMINKGVILKRN